MQTHFWLDTVDKPARYTGGEWNAVQKSGEDLLRFALCFPDVYEVGMSHLGTRILYDALNACDFVFCQRAFAPWPDAERQMRKAGQPLYALESGDALGTFDILGFSLQYEMSYTNVLNMLDLSHVPRSGRTSGTSGTRWWWPAGPARCTPNRWPLLSMCLCSATGNRPP